MPDDFLRAAAIAGLALWAAVALALFGFYPVGVAAPRAAVAGFLIWGAVEMACRHYGWGLLFTFFGAVMLAAEGRNLFMGD